MLKYEVTTVKKYQMSRKEVDVTEGSGQVSLGRKVLGEGAAPHAFRAQPTLGPFFSRTRGASSW